MKINTGCWVDGCRRFDSKDEDGVEIKRDREWVGLTDDEISELILKTENTRSFFRIFEAKLKEKNGF